MVQGLPFPISIYSNGNAEFSIYRARDMLRDRWNDDALKQLILSCRESFWVYGQRLLLDDYDMKAAIYLIKVSYELDNVGVCEWLSIRMVPGQGQPEGVLEPELYYLNGERLDLVIKDRILGGSKDFWSRIVSSSRMCGIKSQTLSGYKLDWKNRFTAQCFALIHKQFVIDYPIDYEYVTAIIGEEFIYNTLTVFQKNKIAQPLFYKASDLLNIEQDTIKLDRSIYAYNFPTYWFNRLDLLELINVLIKAGLITPETLNCYFGVDNIDSISEDNLINMAAMFNSKEKLAGATIDGVELQKIANDKLPERPSLRITPVRSWNLAIERMIMLSNLIKIS